MAPITRRLIVGVVLLGLFAWIFADVLFRDRNLVYRDAGHFYYPLLRLVQEEWRAGRWPLWTPQENGGMPLLANPASAVMYPPRIVLFQWLPLSYAAAYKWYILLHMLGCAGSAYVMARHWKASEFAAGLAALSYAFGAVVMFQYCNVIFLVGAAWVPLALVAADRALARGELRWGAVLGVILALQVLGGDPETAYLVGVLSALYVALADPAWTVGLGAALGLAAALKGRDEALGLLAITVLAAPWLVAWSRRVRPPLDAVPDDPAIERGDAPSSAAPSGRAFPQGAPRGVPQRPSDPARAGRNDRVRLRRRRTLTLALAALVGIGLSAVQWMPSWEFGRISIRAASGPHHEPYAFWVGAWRIPELLWANVSGRQFPENTRWMDALPIPNRLWEPSLYLGALPVLLALAAWGVRGRPAWQRWLSVMLVLSLWGAMGPGGGPSWYVNEAGRNPGEGRRSSPSGPATTTTDPSARRDELLVPPGGLYWAMIETLPGFGTFRYPAKLLTFTAAAIAGLTAVGWDRLLRRSDRRTMKLLGTVAVVSALLAVATLALHVPLTRWWESSPLAHGTAYNGPLLVSRAFWCVVAAFAETAAVLAMTVAALWWTRGTAANGDGAARPPGAAARDGVGAILLVLVAADLGRANRWMVATAPQAMIDTKPAVVEILERAQAADAATERADATYGASDAESGAPVEANSAGRGDVHAAGVVRVHRSSIWWPPRWHQHSSPDQEEEIFRWEKDTIQPKYGLPYGISYTINESTLEPYDYWFFFAPFFRPLPAPLADELRAKKQDAPDAVVYYPRRGYDMWGVRYFVLPQLLRADQEHRGYLAFLPHTERVASSPPDQDDFQVLRNLSCYPRAWIVHQLIVRDPIQGMERRDREAIMEEMLYQGDDLWFDAERERTKKDPHRVAWVEVPHAEQSRVQSYDAPPGARVNDRCRIIGYGPQRVEIEAESSAPGLVVLSDLFFPGWHATVDGEPRPILRTNRMMRGVLLEPGTRHRIVFSYDPMSFRVGGIVTLTTSLALLLVGIFVGVSRRAR